MYIAPPKTDVGTTAVRLHPVAAMFRGQEILIQASPNNSATVLVGDADNQSFELAPGAGMTLNIQDPNDCWVKAVSGTQRVNWGVA